MAKNMVDRFDDDYYFYKAEHDNLIDKELDEIYYLGRHRSSFRKRDKETRYGAAKKLHSRPFSEGSGDEWIDLELDSAGEFFANS